MFNTVYTQVFPIVKEKYADKVFMIDPPPSVPPTAPSH